ncbi:hypothetical protein Tco_0602380, partial [Tanacetum coccineum]
NWRHYIYDTRCTLTRANELYKLELPRELNGIHSTFHVFNLKKCLSDENLVIPLNKFRLDNKLNFIEEPIEIVDRKIKPLSRAVSLSSKFNGTLDEDLDSHGSEKTNSKASTLISSQEPRQLTSPVEL